jgi:ectoine hydroxylase-related dioxygenase (phytanoyl-CoA dioxygenase family)
MTNTGLTELLDTYQRDGFVSGVEILSQSEVLRHRTAMETAEAIFGPLHYEGKVHTILRSPHELATLSSVLDIVEQFIGPNILLHSATYILKEPGSGSFVSWHQDLTYWGFSHDDQVSMWLALSPATAGSGCMRMIPGSHVHGELRHETTEDEANVLFSGQTVADVRESDAVVCALQAGQASFHHGRTLHSSGPNESDDRRIGLNVQYLATHMRQTKNKSDSAILVRGRDDFGHFAEDIAATSDLDSVAVARQKELQARYRSIAGTT